MKPEEMRTARVLLGMTQSELGEALGMSRVMVGLMERGQRPIEPRTALSVECLARRAGCWETRQGAD